MNIQQPTLNIQGTNEKMNIQQPTANIAFGHAIQGFAGFFQAR